MGTLASDASRAGARIANAAQTIVVANQTINVNGHPQWIQDLDLGDLKAAEQKLHRVSVRHEARAILPLVSSIGLTFIAYGLLHLYFTWQGVAIAYAHEHFLMAAPGLLVAIPLWIAFYDSRRRHRRVVQAAEQRWAEVTVEIALRQPLPDPPTPLAVRLRKQRQPEKLTES